MRIGLVPTSILFILGYVFSAAVSANGYIQYAPGPSYRASNFETGRHGYAYFGTYCYDNITGDPINCEVDFSVLGLADVLNNAPYSPIGYPELSIQGGHNSEHLNQSSRPFFYPAGPNFIVWNGQSTSLAPPIKSFSFDTFATQAYVEYSVPEEAGVIAVQVDEKVFDPYFCGDQPYCYDPQTWRFVLTFQVGTWNWPYVQSTLNPVPASAQDFLIRLDNPSIGHRDVTVGNQNDSNLQEEQTLGDNLDGDSMVALFNLALIYHKAHPDVGNVHHRLALNDASLPFGGIYDLAQNWKPDHRGHRDGWAIDVDHSDESQLNALDCSDNIPFQILVTDALKSKNPNGDWESLHCEPDSGNYHINFKDPRL